MDWWMVAKPVIALVLFVGFLRGLSAWLKYRRAGG
jgi:hypothetical protein